MSAGGEALSGRRITDLVALIKGLPPENRELVDRLFEVIPTTGRLVVPEEMVGWVEKGASATVFAMNMDCKEPSHIAARMTVVQQCLADIVAY